MPDIIDIAYDQAKIFINEIYRRSSNKVIQLQPVELDTQINLLNTNDPMKSPYTVFGRIVFTKSYLYFLWTICYYLFRQNERMMDLEIQGVFNGDLGNDIDMTNNDALLSWALSLRDVYSSWPVALPSPVNQDVYCNDTNKIFACALSYVYFHEYAHIINNDIHSTNNLIQKIKEKQADNFARDVIFQICETDNMKRDLGIGLASAGISMLFFINSGEEIIQNEHPDLDVRLDSSINILKIKGKPQKYYLYRLLTNGLCMFCARSGIQYPNKKYWTVSSLYRTLKRAIKKFKKNA